MHAALIMNIKTAVTTWFKLIGSLACAICADSTGGRRELARDMLGMSGAATATACRADVERSGASAAGPESDDGKRRNFGSGLFSRRRGLAAAAGGGPPPGPF